uniref:Uncharacterized protein n=1 Tax=Cacopsylla melanoneura TaxID=428564 RepID=A0A8D8MBA5_9HEMI
MREKTWLLNIGRMFSKVETLNPQCGITQGSTVTRQPQSGILTPSTSSRRLDSCSISIWNWTRTLSIQTFKLPMCTRTQLRGMFSPGSNPMDVSILVVSRGTISRPYLSTCATE